MPRPTIKQRIADAEKNVEKIKNDLFYAITFEKAEKLRRMLVKEKSKLLKLRGQLK